MPGSEETAIPPSDIPRRERMLEIILNTYRRHFDVTLNCSVLGTTLPAMANFRSRSEKYVLTKRAKLWGVECGEYVLFFTRKTLSSEDFGQLTKLLEAAEAELVNPHSEHMYTYISAVVLVDELPLETRAAIRRYKWRKNYLFTFHGWCNIRVAVMDLTSGKVFTNGDGKEIAKALYSAASAFNKPE